MSFLPDPFGKLFLRLFYLRNNIINIPFHSLNFSINGIRNGHFRILEASIVASSISTEQNRAHDKEIAALSQNIHLESSVLR